MPTPSPSRSSPSALPQLALDSLRVFIETQHANGAARLAVFTTCRAGRDGVLSTAPRARLTLLLTAQRLKDGSWQRQLTAAQQALTKRGRLRTALTVKCGQGKAVCSSGAQNLAAFLKAAGKHINELRLECTGNTKPIQYKTLLQAMSDGLGSITSLDLQGCACVIPSPTKLPSLTSIVMTSIPNTKDIIASITTIVPQVTKLQYTPRFSDKEETFTALLTRVPTPYHALTDLNLDLPLNDELLGLLLIDRAPVLKRLTVYDVILTSDQYVTKQWALAEVDIQRPIVQDAQSKFDNEIDMDTINSLAYLPESTTNRMCIKIPGNWLLEADEQVCGVVLAKACALILSSSPASIDTTRMAVCTKKEAM